MSVEIKVPTFPESVADGTIVTWHKKVGDAVRRDEIVADIETDKVVFEVPAIETGVVKDILEEEGATVLSGQVIAHINASKEAVTQVENGSVSTAVASDKTSTEVSAPPLEPKLMPAAQKMIVEHNLDPTKITGTGKNGRVLKEDVQHAVALPQAAEESRTMGVIPEGERPQQRVPMTRLRARIAERLVEAQHTAAILTTFNEVNMQPVMDIRLRYREQFEKTHDVRLGFMSFFVKATVEALKRFPEVNASIDGDDIIYHGFYDIGIAVSSPRGLVVPILRDADKLGIAAIEAKIAEFGQKAKSGTLSLEEITGGTFSISNGGVFGSLLSTPILNPPQSSILGMHKIQKRPVAEGDEIVIRPMMYLALSYDHRIIDGRGAVQFLVTIKELLEDPARILLEI